MSDKLTEKLKDCQDNLKLEDVDFQELLNDLSKIYKIEDPVKKNYQLIQAAKKQGITLESYYRIFEAYSSQQLDIQLQRFFWALLFIKFKKRFEILNRLITSIGGLTVILGIGTFIKEIPQRYEQKQIAIQNSNYQAWKVINDNKNERVNGGRIDALQNLSLNHANLEGVSIENAYLNTIKLKSTNLSYSTFSDVSMENSNFQKSVFKKSIMRDSIFLKSNFQGANLISADLSDSNFESADLTGANLTYTNLSNTNFNEAILKNVSWQKSIYDKKTRFPKGFKPVEKGMLLLSPNVNLSNFYLEQFDLSNNDLTGANLSKAMLYQANLSNTILKNANLSEANLSEADLSGADLSGADLRNAKLTKAKLDGAIFKDANLKNARICNVDLSKIYITREQVNDSNYCRSLDLKLIKPVIK